MSTSGSRVPTGSVAEASRSGVGSSLRGYFFADATRGAQTVLGLIWLLDGALQFQSFMYSRGFIQMLTAMSPGQPRWLASSINWGANIAAGNLGFYNTAFALIQVAIGVGLLYRRAVKQALLASFVWALFVWWFGEAFGMLFMNVASPLTGAPGAAILYALIGLVIWPGGKVNGLSSPAIFSTRCADASSMRSPLSYLLRLGLPIARRPKASMSRASIASASRSPRVASP